MHNIRIKICGITSPEDASLCTSHGADYLGLIFAESPRRITRDAARAVRIAVPDAMLVGVFAGAPVDEVVHTCRQCGINMVQLHGDESPEYCDVLHKNLSLPIIKALSSSELAEPDPLRGYHRTSYFLYDLDKRPRGAEAAPVNGARDRLWADAAAARRKGYRIFLAGALDEHNVESALEHVAPYAIDVASGVERSPGVKDPVAVERFIKAVRG